jgi:hypothetical protein
MARLRLFEMNQLDDELQAICVESEQQSGGSSAYGTCESGEELS